MKLAELQLRSDSDTRQISLAKPLAGAWKNALLEQSPLVTTQPISESTEDGW
jgi:hypothetical protein